MSRDVFLHATRSVTLAALLVFAAGSGARASAQDSGIGISVGAKPAAAQVEDLDGNTVDLGRYIGTKPLLIEFWATWCPVCEALEPRLRAAHAKYGADVEFLVVGVGVSQTPRSIRRHLEKNPMPGRMLFDAKGAAVRAFKVPTTSFIAVLDAAGIVRYTGSGEDQDIDAAIRRVLQR